MHALSLLLCLSCCDWLICVVGIIQYVNPSNGPLVGGNTVTIISATNIGSGSDITDVKINSVSVSSIGMQNQTAVVVRVPAGSIGAVNVSVYSLSFGVATLTNGYTYNHGLFTRIRIVTDAMLQLRKLYPLHLPTVRLVATPSLRSLAIIWEVMMWFLFNWQV